MTISFNNLGSHGRLGNQMFQYAALKGIALRNKHSYMVPPPDTKTVDQYGLFECFTMTTELEFGFQKNVPQYNLDQFHFSEELYYLCPDNVDLVGYFQTEKYFSKFSNQVRSDFTFRPEIVDRVLEGYEKYLEDRPIFLHVRRGDPNLWWAYTNLPEHHPVCTEGYYQEAIKHFDNYRRVIVISDSIDWCKNQDWLSGSRFIFSDQSLVKFSDGASVPYYDLCLMSLCSGAIIANSSMSWWGAWLINEKDNPIVAPKQWFGKALNHYNMDDLIPEDWTVL